jgi:hypothetical protein
MDLEDESPVPGAALFSVNKLIRRFSVRERITET